MPARRRLLLVAGLLSSFPLTASAHAILVGGTPDPGAHISAGTVAVHFLYNSRIDRGRSKLLLLLPNGSNQTVPISPDGKADELNASVTLTPGAYVLRWQVLAVDGHITRGDVPFSVDGPGS